jgi:hypothetical protein
LVEVVGGISCKNKEMREVESTVRMCERKITNLAMVAKEGAVSEKLKAFCTFSHAKR